MKHLRISFLAIVAIIAIGVTAVVKADVLKKKAPVQCQVSNGDLKSVIRSQVLFYNPDEYTTPPVANPPVTTSVSTQCIDDGAAAPGDILDRDIECDDLATQIFCCAKLSGTPGQYVIYCKNE